MVKWIDKLKDRWELKSVGQVMVVLLVFAFTGTTVMVIKKPITELIFGEAGRTSWFTVAYWILILPVYNLMLLLYGFVFGKFRFFWNYERKFFKRLFGRR